MIEVMAAYTNDRCGQEIKENAQQKALALPATPTGVGNLYKVILHN
jgi:hypothetical protein